MEPYKSRERYSVIFRVVSQCKSHVSVVRQHIVVIEIDKLSFGRTTKMNGYSLTALNNNLELVGDTQRDRERSVQTTVARERDDVYPVQLIR